MSTDESARLAANRVLPSCSLVAKQWWAGDRRTRCRGRGRASRRHPRRPTIVTRIVLVGVATVCVAGCEPGIAATRDFTNGSDGTVFIGHEIMNDGPGVREWFEVAPGATEAVGDRGCVGAGRLVVASDPSTDAALDAWELDQDDGWCAGENWTWGAPGDRP